MEFLKTIKGFFNRRKVSILDVEAPKELKKEEPLTSPNDLQPYSHFSGFGIEWKCKECGKRSSELLNGVGFCCSPQLQQQAIWAAERDKKRKDLIWALQSRVLTDEEMAEVAAHDYHLLVQNMVCYNETEIRQQFANMLLQQFKLKAVTVSQTATAPQVNRRPNQCLACDHDLNEHWIASDGWTVCNGCGCLKPPTNEGANIK